MANELLKTLTLEGQTMNILTPKQVQLRNTTTVSLPRNTTQTLTVFTAPKDGWLVGVGAITFATDTTGYRFLDILNQTTGSAYGGIRVAPPTGGQCQLNVPVAIPVQEGNVIQLRYSHLSSANLNVTRRIFEGIFYTKD